MTDTTPEQILARAQAPADQRPAGPQGRDRAPRARHLHRVVAARATLAPQAAAVRPRRARRLVALGALPRLLRGARLGGPRPQPAQPLLVADRGPGDALVRHLHRGRRRGPRAARLRRPCVVGHGMGGLLALKAAERMPISGLVLLSSELPRELRAPARPHELREIPEVYGKVDDRLGDAPRAPAARRSRPDPGRRPAHPAPARPEAARGRRGAPPDARRRAGRPARRSRTSRGWSSAPGSTGRSRSTTRSGWPSGSTPDYEPFAAHSHYGLVIGESSYQQVADAIRGFLEANRL